MRTLQIIVFSMALLLSFYELFYQKLYQNDQLRKKGYKTLIIISIIFFAEQLFHIFK